MQFLSSIIIIVSIDMNILGKNNEQQSKLMVGFTIQKGVKSVQNSQAVKKAQSSKALVEKVCYAIKFFKNG